MSAKKVSRKKSSKGRGHKKDSLPRFTAHFKLESGKDRAGAKRALRAAGLEPIMDTASGGIVVLGTRDAVEKLTSAQLKEQRVTRAMNRGEEESVRRSYAGFRSDEPPPLDTSGFGRLLFPIPASYWMPSAYPPRVDYYHLHPARDLIELFGVESLHAQGTRGSGTRIVMIDSGFYRHPFYEDPGLHGGTVPQITTHGVDPAGDPEDDAIGHGTGIAANTIAIAPECEFHHIKDDNDPVAAFTIARALNPDVITCSWGWSESYVHNVFTNFPNSGTAQYLRDLEAEIDAALANGTTVLFAAGNGNGPGSWPSSHPGVICVGGALVTEDLELVASDYATSFNSLVTPGRTCPDVCGLVGPGPYGLLFALPTQPNNVFDADFSAVDGTDAGDGWLVASGTSSATPQLAGMVALLRQVHGDLSPAEVLQRFRDMAVGVHSGTSATGHIATGSRPNAATGYGFVTFRRPHSRDHYSGLI